MATDELPEWKQFVNVIVDKPTHKETETYPNAITKSSAKARETAIAKRLKQILNDWKSLKYNQPNINLEKEVKKLIEELKREK